MKMRLLLALLAWSSFSSNLVAADFLLNVTADDSTSFYDYFSDSFARMDLRDAPPNEFRQRMHAIPDPSVFYGAIDLFPNDEAMRFGSISYDESSLIGGTGTAAVTGMTLDLLQDPFDATYYNWKRFAGTTVVTGYQGTVDVVKDVVGSFDLTIDLEFHLPSIYGATIEGVYSGQLVLSQNTFRLDAEGAPFLDIVFNPAGDYVHWGWFWSGTINGVVPAVPGDLDGDGFVGQDDLNYILGSWGLDVEVGSVADPSQDGFVGQDDLNIILAAWGKGELPTELLAARAVPEVSPMLLVPLALSAGLLVRRRRTNS